MTPSRSTRSTLIRALLVVVAALVATLVAPLPVARAQSASIVGDGPDPSQPDATYPHRVPGIVYAQFREGYNPMLHQDASSASASGVGTDGVQKILREIGVTAIEPFDADAWKNAISHKIGIDRMYVIHYASNAHPLGVTLRLLQTGLVQSASPRYIFTPQKHIPNDPLYRDQKQWYLDTIQCPDAWDITTGNSSIVIADVDEGVNWNHEDLAANMVDHGYNATNGVHDCMPASGANEGEHGTETTGCFGGIMDNNIGIAGVAPKCKILGVRIANNAGQLTAGYEGIHYAATNGAKVINCSWGGTIDPSGLAYEQNFADEVTANNEVLVASAGNYSKNNDITPFYPANLEGVLSVGATDPFDKPAQFTHYGKTVLVFAPGVKIMTTTLGGLNNAYTSDPGVDGTSFSGPITAGICGLLLSQDATLTPAAVKKIVIETCDPVIGQETNPDYHGRVNAFKALSEVTHPSRPSVSIRDYDINGVASDSLRGIGTRVTLHVTFLNSAAPATNTITATMQPGPGYSWNNYDPQIIGSWPSVYLTSMDNHAAITGKFSGIFRTAQFSEGSAPIKFILNDENGYNDSMTVSVPLTRVPGMAHRLNSAHATCIKQVDSKIGWAGFGYWLQVKNPETGKDTTFKITQFARRSMYGAASRWDYSPTDIPAEVPAESIEALDDQNAWFGGRDPISGKSQVMATTNGGADWTLTDVPVVPRSIHFSSPTTGWFLSDAIARSFQVYQWDDAGQKFTKGSGIPASSPTEKTFFNGLFLNGQFEILGGDTGFVHFTINGGASWNSQPIVGSGKPIGKMRNVMSIAFNADNSMGYAAVRPYGTAPDSAGLYFTQNKGFTWQLVPMKDPNDPSGLYADHSRIPYSVTFKPGTDTAILTTNQGVFLVVQSGATWNWTYFSAPSSWNPSLSMVSAAGNQSSFTISAVSDGSGIVDSSTEAAASVQTLSNVPQLRMVASPNPASGAVQLYFSLATDEHLTIKLLDVLGRTTREIYSGVLGSGDHAIPIETGSLTPGVYHCVLETASGIASQTSIAIMK